MSIPSQIILPSNIYFTTSVVLFFHYCTKFYLGGNATLCEGLVSLKEFTYKLKRDFRFRP